ncbi:MAG: ice-binding family protein [Chitinophagaceae bacterium]
MLYYRAPVLGDAGNFVLFTTTGAVGNTGISQLTGNVGTNSGSTTGFGNVNGVMQNNNGATAQAAQDLLLAYNQLNSTPHTFVHAPLLGNGDTLIAGVYSISGLTTLSGNLTLNGQGNPNAVFIFQISAAFSSGAEAKIKLINGTQACNVFWKIEGMVNLAAGTSFKGNMIVNNAAINMSTRDTLKEEHFLLPELLTLME